MKLEGKVGIVTGGGMGMGEAVARRWAREGAAVVVTDVNEEQGAATAAIINDTGGRAIFLRADSSSEEDWQRVTKEAVGAFGAIHALHNNAGIHLWFDPLNDSMEIWDRLMNINLRGVFLGCRAVIPHMIAAGGGAIVNTASTSGLQGVPLQAAYGASKSGVILMTRSLANAYGAFNVRVNAICPGTIETPMLRTAAAEGRARTESSVAPGSTSPSVALRRMGTADEIASVVTFLVSDESSYVTGVWLPVDGGMTA
jgi:NAD(P)-dependent dehydrogenase (short-subunit alcohol dehydrogenase family)